MTRKLAFAAALIAMGTLAGCARTDNPLAPSTSARSSTARFDGGTISPTTATTSAAASDSTAAPGTGDVIWTQGGN
jgi:hypothetical protein